ncbi:hypothetical protein Hanom_Chr09g00867681 [Helianthus anomalus]
MNAGMIAILSSICLLRPCAKQNPEFILSFLPPIHIRFSLSGSDPSLQSSPLSSDPDTLFQS